MEHPGAARGGPRGRARDGFRHQIRVRFRFRLTLTLVGGAGARVEHPGAARGGPRGRARDGFRHQIRVRFRFRLTLTLVGGQVRVWNIPEQRVVDHADVHEMVSGIRLELGLGLG